MRQKGQIVKEVWQEIGVKPLILTLLSIGVLFILAAQFAHTVTEMSQEQEWHNLSQSDELPVSQETQTNFIY